MPLPPDQEELDPLLALLLDLLDSFDSELFELPQPASATATSTAGTAIHRFILIPFQPPLELHSERPHHP